MGDDAKNRYWENMNRSAGLYGQQDQGLAGINPSVTNYNPNSQMPGVPGAPNQYAPHPTQADMPTGDATDLMDA